MCQDCLLYVLNTCVLRLCVLRKHLNPAKTQQHGTFPTVPLVKQEPPGELPTPKPKPAKKPQTHAKQAASKVSVLSSKITNVRCLVTQIDASTLWRGCHYESC